MDFGSFSLGLCIGAIIGAIGVVLVTRDSSTNFEYPDDEELD